MTASPSPGGDSLRYRIGVVVVLVVAFTLLTIAFLTAETDSNDEVTQTGGASGFVERLFPDRDEQAVQQTQVGIDLVAGWDAVLVIGGVEVPPSQLTKRPDLFQVSFTPGPGKVIEELQAGTNCVAAVAWRLADGRGPGNRTVRWCFEVV